MSLAVERVDVWAATIEDQPGGLAEKLAPLAEAGADLEFVIARRAPDKPGTGVVFVTPLQGSAQTSAGATAGFAVADSLHSVRIEGDDRPGIGAQLTRKLADAGINLRGLSAAVIEERFIMYLALDTADDAEKAMSVLQEVP
ncbi:MAG: ACT domain-containing protein [Planctomycetota bacterium]|jgi:predicted amino acid-binding ACT domain protein